MIQTAMIAGSILTRQGLGRPLTGIRVCRRNCVARACGLKGGRCAGGLRVSVASSRLAWWCDDLGASVCSSAISSRVIVPVSPFTRLSVLFRKWEVAAAECAAQAVSDMSPERPTCLRNDPSDISPVNTPVADGGLEGFVKGLLRLG